MPNQVSNYQCPACTGPLHYVGASGKLECDYCGTQYELQEIERLHAGDAAQAAQAAAQVSPLQQWGAEDGMKAYSCPSCGAELLCDETTTATSCPYCGNPTVVPGQFTGGLKPDCIIPFTLEKKQAKEALGKYYKGKKFLPKGFAEGNRIDELKGVYVPFWLYDGVVNADVSYRAEKRSTLRRGDVEITETAHFTVRRAGYVPFQGIPVNASSKMSEKHMEAIEPYDYNGMKPFSPGYLPGFLADKYNQSIEQCAPRADERAEQSALNAMRTDVKGYDSVMEQNHHTNIIRQAVHYCLLPVYLLGTTWEGQQYLFAMNGQTGKLVGDLPVDKGKYWATFGGIAAAVTAILGSLLYFLSVVAKPTVAYGLALAIGLIAALITCSRYKWAMQTARKASSAKYYAAKSADIRVRDDRFTHTTRSERRIENKSSSPQHK